MSGMRQESIFRRCQRIFSRPRGNSRPPAFFEASFISGSTKRHAGRLAVVLGDEEKIPVGIISELADDTIELVIRERHRAPVLGPRLRVDLPYLLHFVLEISLIYRPDDELGILESRDRQCRVRLSERCSPSNIA